MNPITHVYKEHYPLPKSRDTPTKWLARRVDEQGVEHGRWRRVYVDETGTHFTLSSNPRYHREDLDGVPTVTG